jgi:ribosome maturation protein SDO1
MKKGGKRFEIACYKNKVLSWRNKVEKDIDEVLQTHSVFMNVSKGQVAKREDLLAAFGTDDQTAVCKLILDKGELQVSERERTEQLDALMKDVANTIAGLCVNPDTKRPYPVSIIEKGLKEVHFTAKPGRNSKQQALEAIPKLKTAMNIDRAQMRVRISMGTSQWKSISEKVEQMGSLEDKEWNGDNATMTLVIDPGHYRQLDDLIRSETKGKGMLEVLNLKEIQEGEETVE